MQLFSRAHYLVFPLAIALAIPVALRALAPKYCLWSVSTGTNSSVIIDEDVLVIAGGIDDGLVNDVQSTLSRSANPIKRIQITSYGGKNASMAKLVSAVAVLGPIPIEVPKTCQSACIGFLATTPGPKRIAPSATLMFHSASMRSGPKRTDPLCSGVRFFDFFANIGSNEPHDMLPWAAQLTDRLPALFSLCPVNPLDTERGITLTGQEYNDLRSGRIAIDSLIAKCPDNGS